MHPGPSHLGGLDTDEKPGDMGADCVFIEKQSTHTWPQAVQTSVVQKSAIHLKIAKRVGLKSSYHTHTDTHTQICNYMW